MTDLEPNDWTDDDAAIDADLERQRIDRNVCIRDRPEGAVCDQGYDHVGPCDWLDLAATRRNIAQASYNAVNRSHHDD